jgi:two-component system C4-dicarboxylate transport response regulator DctD
MFESELFGHEIGAFTSASTRRIGRLESANGGTVFLDELESLPLAAQVKLLRVIQERSIDRLGSNRPVPIDVRIMAATQIDLLEATNKGEFRADLYYRLAVTDISVPALRSRSEDIPLLFEFFVSEAVALHERERAPIEIEHIHSLLAYDWPGNVRELKNVAERFVLSGGKLTVARNAVFPRSTLPSQVAEGLNLAKRVDEFERRIIVAALASSNGDIRMAMSMLQVPRRTLNEKMLRHSIDRHDFVPTAAR